MSCTINSPMNFNIQGEWLNSEVETEIGNAQYKMSFTDENMTVEMTFEEGEKIVEKSPYSFQDGILIQKSGEAIGYDGSGKIQMREKVAQEKEFRFKIISETRIEITYENEPPLFLYKIN